MALLRHWAYTLCLAAVLLSVLQGILPVKNMSAVIKLVAGIYILLLLLTPVQAYSVGSNILDVETGSGTTDTIDLTQAVRQQTEKLLSDKIVQALQLEGITDVTVEVDSSINSANQLELNLVTIRCDQILDFETVEQALRNTLEYLPPYEVMNTDGTKNGTDHNEN